MEMLLKFDKKANYPISRFMLAKEFGCNCKFVDCNFSIIAKRLRAAWVNLRFDFAKPLIINSGHRCQRWNKLQGGTRNSKHLQGLAIDISIEGISPKEYKRLLEIAREEFDVVIEYPTFIHCHMEPIL